MVMMIFDYEAWRWLLDCWDDQALRRWWRFI